MSENEGDAVEWTPLRGLLRGFFAGLIAAIVLAAVLWPVAEYAHGILIAARPRTFIAFGVAWIIFGIVEYAAGMTGWITMTLSCILSALVMLSNHLVWSYTGLPIGEAGATVGGVVPMFNPGFVVITNIWTIIGIGVCALLCRDGQPGPEVIGSILSMRIWGTR
jgi:hypothetical protein